ncbi:hypothetical protein C0J52_05453 [Blattella germanica]|nr:hypothetical protein C0J52_05453 [Blattella germanica]
MSKKSVIAIVDTIENDPDLSKSISDIKMKMKRGKDKTYILNGTVVISEDFAPDLRVHVGIFRLRSARWENMLIRIDEPVCQYLKNDKDYWPQIVKAGNAPAECPFKKGTININNASLKLTKIPPNLQPGCYKVLIQLLEKPNKLVSSTIARCRVTATGDGSDVGRCAK